MQLGKKIRDLRCRRGLTVQQLAAASSLSKGFISQVEHGRTSPSLASLKDLARALDTSVAYLVVEEDEAPHVVRGRQRPRIGVADGATQVEILSARPRRNLEILMTELPPGVRTGNGWSGVGEQCLVCLEGQVTVVLGEHRLQLESGDSCHSDGHPHTIENSGAGVARVLIATTPATFDPRFSARAPAPPTNGRTAELDAVP